ncbi:hypothetical protein C8J57DRAFT_1503996 [Mycena rebaudengoi]|nr:hypothetical protein C8J57DRAFT_1503996 [Mycena rebaudengoi]
MPDDAGVSVTSTPNVPIQLADIDNEITDLYARIHALKAKRNTIAPIFTRTNETLSRVITIYVVQESYIYTWWRAMLICHLWHEIILTSQHLWRNLDMSYGHSLGRVTKQLELSGVEPLTIILGSTGCLSLNGAFCTHLLPRTPWKRRGDA